MSPLPKDLESIEAIRKQYMVGSEKTVMDQIRDDYTAGLISKKEYGEKFLEEIDRRQKIMSKPLT